MGDVVITSPIVRCLYNQLNAEIHFLVKPVFAPLVKHNPSVKTVHLYEKQKLNSLKEKLELENFDLIIDLQKNRRSVELCKKLNVSSIAFKKENIKKWVLVQTGINLMPKKHLLDRYFDALQTLSIQPDGKGYEIFVSQEDKRSVDSIGLPNQFIAIGTGAQHRGKCLTFEHLSHVIKYSSLPVILLGGEGEKNLAETISTDFPDKVRNLVGKTSLLETADIISRSNLCLSGDTGVMHMAAAFKIPQVSVWGCTDPILGMYPYLAHESSIILTPLGHYRRPCSKLGSKCKYAPQYCISSVDPDSIVKAITLALKE